MGNVSHTQNAKYYILILNRPETTDSMIMFFDEYRARSKPTGTLPTVHVLKKHNHLRRAAQSRGKNLHLTNYSNVLSIGTEDTAQADKIMEFINDCLEAAPEKP